MGRASRVTWAVRPSAGQTVRVSTPTPARTAPLDAPDLAALEEVQRRVLWLATSIVHHANRVRETPSGVKVGGHQASSASMVSLMTALWFDQLGPEDRVSVKPHASPVLHAIHHLLGELDADALTTLRRKGGLQSYPSRTKDPDRHLIDYSTGSVGIGATAPIWGALSRRYLATHLGLEPGGRQISLLGDAELDEGAVWEAVADPMVAKLGELLWVVDLNRQSLDRVVPDIAATRLMGMFDAAGWQVVPLKYGRFLDELFTRTDGDALRRRIDTMGNEEFQRLVRVDGPELRDRLAGDGALAQPLRRLLDGLPDADVRRALRDLGGHDLGKLTEAFRSVDPDRPTVVFAYTVKGWSLPTEGHPSNHSALLETEQWRSLGAALGADPDAALGAAARRVPARSWWPGRRSGWPARPSPRSRRRRCRPSWVAATPARTPPRPRSAASSSTCSATPPRSPAGWSRSARTSPRRRTSAAGSTRSASSPRPTGRTGSPTTPTGWSAGPRGPPASTSSSGIAEVNLVGLMGELGATWLTTGEPLLPVGTMYDPFVTRALEPWCYGVYAGGQSILVGTPSGITLAPEGGAHQSIITPSIGIEQPGVCALGAGLRPGPGVDVPRRALPAGPPGRGERVLPALHPAGGPGAGRACRADPAGTGGAAPPGARRRPTGCAAPRATPTWCSSRWG